MINCGKVTGRLSTHLYVPGGASDLSSNYIKFNYAAYSKNVSHYLFAFCSAAERRGYKHEVVILAGGLGTRISEESVYKPKPMIEIGSMPFCGI